MIECERLSTCPFFSDKMADVPAVAGVMKKTYCLTEPSRCARYQVVSQGKKAPADLYPNQANRVAAIVKG
jgi:hypothetical protein